MTDQRAKEAADNIRFAKIAKMIEKGIRLSLDDSWFYTDMCFKKGILMELYKNDPMYEGIDTENHKCSKCRFFSNNRCYNIESLHGEELSIAKLSMAMEQAFGNFNFRPECDANPKWYSGHNLRYNSIGLSCFRPL